MKPLDALSGLVMLSQAAPDDMVFMVMKDVSHSALWRCMHHTEDNAHYARHRNDAVEPLLESPIDRIIARDDIVDNVRKGVWQVYAVRPLGDPTAPSCVRCSPDCTTAEGMVPP